VDVFDVEGNFLHRLSMNVSGDTLEAPFWTRADIHKRPQPAWASA
jgi:hypothetical protein